MKNLRTYFCVVFLLYCVNGTYSQFNSIVKKGSVVKVVSPADNGSDRNIISEDSRKGTEEDSMPVSPDGAASLLSRMRDRLLFSSPLESDTLLVTSCYGMRKDPFSGRREFHDGTDFKTDAENVFSMMPGRIRDIGYDRYLGNYIRIAHGDLTVIYGHLFSVIGRKGDALRAGQSVGISGSTGRSTGDHLHIAMRYKGKRIDPLPVIRYVSSYARKLQRSVIAEADSIRSTGLDL